MMIIMNSTQILNIDALIFNHPKHHIHVEIQKGIN